MKRSALILIALLALAGCQKPQAPARDPEVVALRAERAEKQAKAPSYDVLRSALRHRRTAQFAACVAALGQDGAAGKAGCLQSELKTQQAVLTDAYGRLSSTLKPEQASALTRAQADWLALIEQDCRVYAASGFEFECRIDRTIGRTMTLEGMAAAVKATGAPTGVTATVKSITEPRYSIGFGRCSAENPIRPECIEGEAQFQDEALSRAYEAAMSDLEPEAKTALSEGQRRWAEFRQDECAMIGAAGGAAAAGLCGLDRTIERTIYLEQLSTG